ncbi:MAG: type II toxin-antitoxin system HicA family toxin [Thaumarchaeota archaeon]|nr:type II toxin-antitoxin system HicA family toxin [Nitrososphaerota archaeon]MDE1877917.1 type II toxin-antitoxin system HicA family toxin [Nitrososphaerota archaeon]
MSLRNLSWREIVKTMSHFGFYPVRQRGSHIILKNTEGSAISIPRYDSLPEGTVRAILEEAGISKEEFLKHL